MSVMAPVSVEFATYMQKQPFRKVTSGVMISPFTVVVLATYPARASLMSIMLVIRNVTNARAAMLACLLYP